MRSFIVLAKYADGDLTDQEIDEVIEDILETKLIAYFLKAFFESSKLDDSDDEDYEDYDYDYDDDDDDYDSFYQGHDYESELSKEETENASFDFSPRKLFNQRAMSPCL